MSYTSPKRVGISKKIRFDILARDNFTCRYCGRQSDVILLHVDHIIPVCRGGTNDPENLIAACSDCNAGKAGRTPQHAAPSETDRLRLSQERNEQIDAFKAAKAAKRSKERLIKLMTDYWCDGTGRDSVERGTIHVVTKYVEEFGFPIVSGWIDKAIEKVGKWNDRKIGSYVSGIRRNILNTQAKVNGNV